MACIIASCVPTASTTLCAPSPPVRSLIVVTPASPRFFDDVGGTELAGELLAGLVTAHRNDPLRAELFRGHDREEPDGPVTNDCDRLARADLGRHGTEPAGSQIHPMTTCGSMKAR